MSEEYMSMRTKIIEGCDLIEGGVRDLIKEVGWVEFGFILEYIRFVIWECASITGISLVVANGGTVYLVVLELL